jgi:hypothetical protein
LGLLTSRAWILSKARCVFFCLCKCLLHWCHCYLQQVVMPWQNGQPK